MRNRKKYERTSAYSGGEEKKMVTKMQMTNEEIVRSYNEAKHKGHQIGVLADLNVCPKEVIINILIEGGVNPKAFSRYKGENNIKRVKREVQAHEKKKRSDDEAAVIKEAVTALWDKLTAEYNELKTEWEHISAEYEHKLSIIEKMLGVEVCSDDT